MKKLAAKPCSALEWAHPLVRDWFLEKFGSPTEPQQQGWPHILAQRTTLISAPTGSGKTLAAFLACIDRLVRLAADGKLSNQTQVVYVSPLKALSNDIQKNLDAPLAEIKELALSRGIEMQEIVTAVRTGDTPLKDRQSMLKRRPHILVTTPESLYILLTAEKSREMLQSVETVIVDEIHAVADDKRGAHLALTLERLAKLTKVPPNRVGLSATQNPIELVAEFLTGGGGSEPVIVNVGHRRVMDLAIEVPAMPLAPVASQEFSAENFDRLAKLVQEHRSTLIFVNTRKQAERISMQLASRLGEDAVACHHGSLSRQLRLAAETRLKNGEIQALVATASLELGIDIGFVDLVCQVNTVKTIATALQRVGRAGHWRGAIPKGRFFPFTRDELVETAALIRAIKHNELDKLEIPECPVDILAQQIVAMVAVEEVDEEQLFTEIRKAYPYRNLEKQKFTQVIEMLSDGISSRRGRYGAYLLRDQVNGKLKARRGARLAAITSGGAIPETALYAVIQEPEGHSIGTLDEHFAIDSHRGDVVLLGNTSWRIRRIDNVGGKVFVEDAHGAPPSVPFWFGEAPARSDELSKHVSELRDKINELTRDVGLEFGAHSEHTPEVREAIDWLKTECGVTDSGAEQLMEYVIQGRAMLGEVPTTKRIIAERFFDEGGGMQLIIHAPFGGRINRAWGLALRKKFCRSFNFELQAAATEDGLSIALAEQHSFPLGDVFYFLAGETVKHTLEQASIPSPIFATRWRWDAMRSLALLRFMGGKKVPPYLQRLRSDDLLAAVFPQAAACQDNVPGDIELPDHPLINEVMKDVLTEAMDLEGLERIIAGIKNGEIQCIAVDTPTPSQFAAEIINANVYAYLDDAGVEERRTRAVQMRRVLPGSIAGELGQLDPQAIAKVIEQAWPDIQNADELHDLMLSVVAIPETNQRLFAQPAVLWSEFMSELSARNRASRMTIDGSFYWVATERIALAELIWPHGQVESKLPTIPNAITDRSAAILAALRGWMNIVGPTTVEEISEILRLEIGELETAFVTLESEGRILRGQFKNQGRFSTVVTGLASMPISAYEWCDRRLLARVHKLTLATLRKGIEPVTAAVYARWLCHWQHVAPGTQLAGERGLLEVIRQLQGFEVPARDWEAQILSKRVKNYKPELLDSLCLKGAVGWGRLSSHPSLEVTDMLSLGDAANAHGYPQRKKIASAKVTPLRSKKRGTEGGEQIHSTDGEGNDSTGGVINDSTGGERNDSTSGERNDSTGGVGNDSTGGVGNDSTRGDNSRFSAHVPPLAEELSPGVIKRVIPTSVAPVTFFVRDDADWMSSLPKTGANIDLYGVSNHARSVEAFLSKRGASFFADVVRGTGLTKLQTERALWELVTAGIITADGFANLRLLIDPARAELRPGRSKRFRDAAYGRWSLLHSDLPVEKTAALEAMCRVLLRRYGVVFRNVVLRESNLPPWRELLAVFRSLEDRGEVRGGRFVNGFIGEQFALPEAVDSLRASKKESVTDGSVTVAQTDPTNLVGTVLPADENSSGQKSMQIIC